MKKLLIFFVLLSSISSFGQVQRPKMNPATLNWLLPFSITKQAYHATDSAVYSSPSGVIYKAPIQSGGATFDTTTYQATHHTWSKSNIFSKIMVDTLTFPDGTYFKSADGQGVINIDHENYHMKDVDRVVSRSEERRVGKECRL